jgi:hypothetical protein
MRIYLAAAALLFALAPLVHAGENLKINPKLDDSSDSNDGPRKSPAS